MSTAQDRVLFDPENPAVAAAVKQLEEAIGGRQALADTLIAAPPDEDGYDVLLGLIADPRNDHKSLATLLNEGGFTAGDLLKLYRSAVVAKAQVLAIHEVATELPSVTRDVMRRSQNHYKLCSSCASTGQVWEPILDAKGKPTGDRQKVVCGLCEGSGQVLAEASLDHQKMALDMAGMLQKSGPSTLVQVDNSRTATVVATMPFAQLQRAVQKVLDPVVLPSASLPAAQPGERFEPSPTLEAVVVESPHDARAR